MHRARNLYASCPSANANASSTRTGGRSTRRSADAKQKLQALVHELDNGSYTAASSCLADDLDALVVHVRYPPGTAGGGRSTNLLERSLGEVKRPTKVMGRFAGEESCLTLVYAVLDLLITRLKRLRYQGHEKATAEQVSAA